MNLLIKANMLVKLMMTLKKGFQIPTTFTLSLLLEILEGNGVKWRGLMFWIERLEIVNKCFVVDFFFFWRQITRRHLRND